MKSKLLLPLFLIAGIFLNAQAVCMKCILRAREAAARVRHAAVLAEAAQRAAAVVIPTAVAPIVYPTINKQILIDEIKADLYKIFVQEMGIGAKDYAALAQGDAVLEADLKALYMSLNQDKAEAQKALDAFCAQWQLETIIIA